MSSRTVNVRRSACRWQPSKRLQVGGRGWLLVCLVAGWPGFAPAVRAEEAGPVVAGGEAAVEHPSLPVRRYLGEVFAWRGQTALRADVTVPERPGRVPAVLLIHGGAWTVGTRWQMLIHSERLARQGFATVSIDYRLAPQWKFPAQIEDCRDAWRWMCREADRFGWDADRMAVYGYSAGAHLALLVALDGQGWDAVVARPKAVVAGGAPCALDWFPEDSQALAHFLGGTRRQIPQVYQAASPISHVSADDPPVLLFHGGKDLLVPLANPRRLKERLDQVGVPCQLLVYEQWGHIATFFAPEPVQQAAQFLAKYLVAPSTPAESVGNRR